MYNSDTVYSTTTFRPVSPFPAPPPADKTPSPQRTRKLETPLHFDGGLFSDIRSAEGKLLSTVTVDRVRRSTHREAAGAARPGSARLHERGYVDDMVNTETVTNRDVITVKFTPVPAELDRPRLLTFATTPATAPLEYIKNDFEDLHSYKIVNSLCREKLFDSGDALEEALWNEKVENSAKEKEGSTRFSDDLITDYKREAFERLDTIKSVLRASSESLYIPEPGFRAPSESLYIPEPGFRAPSESLYIPEPGFRAPSESLYIPESGFRAPSESLYIPEPGFRAPSESLYIPEPGFRAASESLSVAVPVLRASSEGPKTVEPTFRAPSESVNTVEQIFRCHSPLANLLVSEQLSKIDSYLQESLDVCLGRKTPSPAILTEVGETTVATKHVSRLYKEKSYLVQTTQTAGSTEQITSCHEEEPTIEKVNHEPSHGDKYDQRGKKINSVNKQNTGVLSAVYSMPVHYHAAILCFLLIIYNLVYQYIKQNCLGNKK